MKKQEIPEKRTALSTMKVDNRGQRYLVYPDGQMRRLSPDGTPLPGVRISKKERLKLRKEYRKIKEQDQKNLTNKIIESPVINPVSKQNFEVENSRAGEFALETVDA
jgi:hypothetical protein